MYKILVLVREGVNSIDMILTLKNFEYRGFNLKLSGEGYKWSPTILEPCKCSMFGRDSSLMA